MSERDYQFWPATFHILHADGPRGFILRFVLAYAAVMLVTQAFAMWLQGDVYRIYIEACIENGCDFGLYVDEINEATMRSNLASIIMIPFYLAWWCLFEAASQRRYVRGERFRLAIGADEGRLAIVGMIWFALLIAGYFALIFGAAIPGLIVGLIAGAAAGVIIGVLMFLAGLGVALWLFARLSPAGSLTIRDQQIRFFEAWSLTRGHGGAMAMSYFILFAGFLLAMAVGYAVMILVALALLAPAMEASPGSADAVFAAMRQPRFWIPVALAMLPLGLIYGAFVHAMGGPAAWLVRHGSPGSASSVSQTFS